MRWPESPGRWRAARSGASLLPMRRLASIQCSSQLSQRGKAGRLPRVDLERSLELLDRAQHHPLLRVDAPQVHVREVPWLIARSRLGLLQPLDRLVELPLLDEVGPDVVVRVAEGLVGKRVPCSSLPHFFRHFMYCITCLCQILSPVRSIVYPPICFVRPL